MPVWASSGALWEPVQGSKPCLRCLGGVGVCGAQRFPCRSAPGPPGSRRTRRSYGRYQTCRGTSCLEKGSAVNPSGRAGACVTPGCLSQSEGLVGLRNSQQTELPVQQTACWAWSAASPQFPALFCLLLVVISDRGAPAMSALAAATGWKLEMLRFVLHTWFCCSVLLLLLEMNSSLLSVSPFHKKAWLRVNWFFVVFFFHGQLFVFMMLQQHFLRLKPANCPV